MAAAELQQEAAVHVAAQALLRLQRRVASWSLAEDEALHRLCCYMWHTQDSPEFRSLNPTGNRDVCVPKTRKS